MTKSFVWCPAHALLRCQEWWPVPHVHVSISGTAEGFKTPQCGGPTLQVVFQDLDPSTIRRTPAYANNPQKGDDLIATCMKEEHAAQIAAFVAEVPDDQLIVVNCEGGVSRSPGVVLALRRHYGGDTEEVFKKAHPNIHVTSLLWRVLGKGGADAKIEVLRDEWAQMMRFRTRNIELAAEANRWKAMHEAASENERLAKLENSLLKELLSQAGAEIHLKGGHTALSIQECSEVCCQKIAKATAELKPGESC